VNEALRLGYWVVGRHDYIDCHRRKQRASGTLRSPCLFNTAPTPGTLAASVSKIAGTKIDIKILPGRVSTG
jgi:hypothetical protein